MERIPYPHVNETLYHQKLENGLKVYVLPKPGFQKTYAIFTTHYGSIDNRFQVEGKPEVRVPDGIAHFLEHKMFEEPTGDVFAQFASLGASANAFTSFDRTSYLFSATDEIYANLETLINFVQNPYFTDQNVEKEKGIIGQEITMYQDNPDWRAYYGLIEALYGVHPIHIDIAGTIESISQITKETLYECYHTFYHPSNMMLFVVGGVEAEEVIRFVALNQAAKSFPEQGSIRRIFDPEPASVHEPRKLTRLPVSQPKCYLGCKETHSQLTGYDLLRQEIVTKLVFDTLLSPSSTIFQTLYDEQVISDSFGYEYNVSRDYGFSIIGGDVLDPERFIQRLQEEINKVMVSGIAAEDFERSRRKKIGGFLRTLNSPEAIANEFTKYQFKDTDLFQILPLHQSITLEEVNRRLKEHFDWNQMAVSIVASEPS